MCELNPDQHTHLYKLSWLVWGVERMCNNVPNLYYSLLLLLSCSVPTCYLAIIALTIDLYQNSYSKMISTVPRNKINKCRKEQVSYTRPRTWQSQCLQHPVARLQNLFSARYVHIIYHLKIHIIKGRSMTLANEI